MATHTPAFKQIASGLRFPEGPVAMPDGSVILVEIERRTLSRVTPDGKVHVIADARRRAQRRRDGAGRQDLRHQQRRAQVRWSGRARLFPVAAGRRLHRRQHPDRGSGDRQVRDAVRPLRRPAAARAQRPRVRRRGRVLVHRPRQDARARCRPRRRLLRQGGRLADRGGDLPARAPERHRPVPGRAHALRGRDADRALLVVPALRARPDRVRQRRRTGARRARSSRGSAATRCSTRSRWTARATFASPP